MKRYFVGFGTTTLRHTAWHSCTWPSNFWFGTATKEALHHLHSHCDDASLLVTRHRYITPQHTNGSQLKTPSLHQLLSKAWKIRRRQKNKSHAWNLLYDFFHFTKTMSCGFVFCRWYLHIAAPAPAQHQRRTSANTRGKKSSNYWSFARSTHAHNLTQGFHETGR